MNRVAIIGAGDLGVQLAHHLKATDEAEAVGFFDDTVREGTRKSSLPVLGNLSGILPQFRKGSFDSLLVGIGYNHLALRKRLFERLEPVIPFATVIHPSARVDESSFVAPGSVIFPGCILDLNTRVESNTIVNVGCVIAHDTTIGESSFLSPSVNVAGFTQVKGEVILGIGTTVIDNITISSGVRTGAGAVVINDLAEPGLYVGVPARLKKRLSTA